MDTSPHKSCFFQLIKVDAETGVFEGVMASAALDAQRERLDYWASKSVFRQWSQTQAENTGHRSWGNLRAQHNPQEIAGVLIKPLEFDDAKQQIKCTGKALGEHKDFLLTGAYGGMSIGGGYASRKPLSDGTTLYVPGPLVEVSLVDKPSNPECTFAVIKADGSRELRKFAPSRFQKMDAWKRRDVLHLLGSEVAVSLRKASDGRATSNANFGPAPFREMPRAAQLAYTTARRHQRYADVETEDPYIASDNFGHAPQASGMPAYPLPENNHGVGRQARTQPTRKARINPNLLVAGERIL